MKRFKKLWVSLAALVIGLPLLEVGLRLANFRHREFDMPPIVWNPRTDKQLGDDDFLFRAEQGQLWAPNPGVSIPWGEGEVVNEAGYRGPLRPVARTAGRLRIVTLGDSSTFGHSLPYEDCYSAQLEAELKRRGVDAEVLCGGVVGHGILQGIQRYEQVFRKYRPDVVVLAYGAINEHTPAPGANSEEERIRASFEAVSFGESLARRIRPLGIGHLAAWIADGFIERDPARDAALIERQHKQFNQGYGSREWPGVRSVDPERFQQALAEFVTLVEADGALPIFVSMPRTAEKEQQHSILVDYTEKLEQHCRETQAAWIDPRSSFLELEAAGNPSGELLLDPVHPTAEGHALIAQQLAEMVAHLQQDKGLEARD